MNNLKEELYDYVKTAEDEIKGIEVEFNKALKSACKVEIWNEENTKYHVDKIKRLRIQLEELNVSLAEVNNMFKGEM
jgi:hypothetical protein